MTIRRGRLAALAAAGLCIALPAAAAPQPVLLTATFTDKPAGYDAPETPTPACVITFTSISDARRDPGFAGDMGNRPVRAPDDFQAWMHSVLGGLKRRGVTPQFPAAGAPAADATPAGPTAQLTLHMAWVQPAAIDLSSNVIVSIDATTPNGRAVHQTYRGRVSKMNWVDGSGEGQRAIDYAFADFLDKAAPDLRTLCQA